MAYLVRHAHAGEKHQWVGPDHDRPLSVAGQVEAHGLLTRLGGYRISRILSGPAIRCQQTVVPLAARFGLPVELTDDLAVKAAADQLLGLVTDPALETAVLCSHGEVIGQVLQQLVAGGLVLADPLRWEKGSTWVLDSRGGVVVGPGIWRRFDLRSWRRSLRKPCLADPPVPRTRPRAGRLVSWIWRRLPEVPERNQRKVPCSIGRLRGLPSAVTESAPPWDGRGSCVPADR